MDTVTPLSGKRAVTFTNRIAASLRGLGIDLQMGTITRAQYDASVADHQRGLADRGLAPLIAPYRPVTEPTYLTA